MHTNEQQLTDFYTAFSKKDYKTMQQCYADNAVFNDPVFKNLTADEVRAMWEMFCLRGKDLQITFSDVQADDHKGTATWVAHYTFSATRRKVKNTITANVVFENGKIVRHTDNFSFYTWARQAFGVTGILLGWTNFFKNKVQNAAKQSLMRYMEVK